MIRKAKPTDANLLASLAHKLWPQASLAELTAEFTDFTQRTDQACFIAFTEKGQPIGFAHTSLRLDYVEGCSTSPVGYLEGIYVEPAFRGKKIALALVQACEAWAKAQGCKEFASDCELHNTQSLAFHLAVGFAEENRIICFRKDLD